MRIGVYAGSLRPGGGITALRQVLDGLLAMEDMQVTVFTGAPDCSSAIQDLLAKHPLLVEEAFQPGASSFSRYVRSKFAFRERGRDFDWLFSINYFLPSPCRVAVYHLNLLSFQRGPNDGVATALKRFDARWACRHADRNLFESQFLLDRARAQVRQRLRADELLYLGIHPAFFAAAKQKVLLRRNQLLLVSSTAAHKDNSTALHTLAKLTQQRPEVEWELKIAGGQSVGQWEGLLQQAAQLGLAERIQVLGPLDRSALSLIMQSSLCLLSPSQIESFCMVALEAMASFCPTVVTSATSMPESVGDAAILVEPGDAEAFCAAVLRYYDDDAFRADLVTRGRLRAESFGAERFHRQLYEALSR